MRGRASEEYRPLGYCRLIDGGDGVSSSRSSAVLFGAPVAEQVLVFMVIFFFVEARERHRVLASDECCSVRTWSVSSSTRA